MAPMSTTPEGRETLRAGGLESAALPAIDSLATALESDT
jgi:hypothetical protein